MKSSWKVYANEGHQRSVPGPVLYRIFINNPQDVTNKTDKTKLAEVADTPLMGCAAILSILHRLDQ